eukprot:scaffold633_cov134-Isochrysis_galbana.AAC.9
MSSFPSPGSVSKLWEYDCAVGRCRPHNPHTTHNGCRSLQTSYKPPHAPERGICIWEGPHVILHFVNNDDVCARFRNEELNPSSSSSSSVKEEGLSCGGSYKPLVNDVMTDPLTDTILTKGRERSAPGMSHADTHTPLHGPTGGVPSDKRHSPTSPPEGSRVSCRIRPLAHLILNFFFLGRGASDTTFLTCAPTLILGLG